MRLLAVDLGTKRIGLAVGDTEVGLVSPRPALAATGTLRRDAEAIVARARQEEAAEVVLGLPLDLDGAEGKIARAVRMLGGLLQERGLAVHYAEESFTSVQAEASLLQAGFKASERRDRRDGEAACVIWERFVHAQT